MFFTKISCDNRLNGNQCMNTIRGLLLKTIIVIAFGLMGAIFCQFFKSAPVSRYIHIRNFRYGKDPWVIRCNRGDTLHLTFSTEDTGHSFFLEEFDMDVKISPATEEVTVFKTSDPSARPLITREVVLVTRHSGWRDWLISKSSFRCHVWCGPMHAFEQGKLVIIPNTLLWFSIGMVAGIFALWIYGFSSRTSRENEAPPGDILNKNNILRRALVSRWPQIIITIFALLMIYIVIMTALFGTKVSGRNLGVLLMWAIWLFILIAIMTPLGGRIWCTICPLPVFGDWIQRRSFLSPFKGRTGEYNNRFFGLFRKWPGYLSNNWPRLIVFLILATFSTTLVAVPVISGVTVLMLVLVPTLMSGVWELRAFCRYLCPVSVFVGPFSGMSILALRNKSQAVCDECKTHFCRKGNLSGWACPYGINVGEMKENADCGLCLECLRSCTYNNVTLYKRPFASETATRNMGEGWLTIAIFTISIIYSILYLGPWPAVRDYVNIIDKQNWGLFAVYSLILWSMVLVIVPGIIYFLAAGGRIIARSQLSSRNIFLSYTGSLMPMGMLMWIAFVIPMLFVNITFIRQSVSDPFGWGWDFFGTAGTPWHQFLPEFIPWMQAIAVCTGLYLCLRNISRTMKKSSESSRQAFLLTIPFALFVTAISLFMIFFYTN